MAKIKKDTSLRKAILQAAITGQLISNVDGETETGKQLLDRIIEERNKKLLAEWEEKLKENLKTKKPVPIVVSEIDDDEIPFEIPESWCWCRLGDLFRKITDGTHKTPKYLPSGIPFLSVKDMSSGKLNFSNTKFISEEEHKELYKRCNPERGDLLITKVGTTGIPVIVDTDVVFDLFVSVALCKPVLNIIDMNFMVAFINSPFVQQQIERDTIGSANKNWVIDKIIKTLIPLPPLAVQNAIVAKLEEVLPLVDAYENAVLQKEELKTALPEKVKKAILQEAIQGKLTEDWRKTATIEETGKQLLDRIIEERNAKLLAEWEEAKKKNPKAKKPTLIVASEIDEEDIPFEVPDSWCWCRLGDLGITNTGTTPSKNNPEYFGKHIDFLSPGDIQDSKITYGNQGLSESGYKVARPTPPGTIIQVCIGGSIGKCAIVDREVTFNQQINSITVIKCSTQYVYSVLSSDYFHCIIRENSTGTATPIINKSSWEKLLFPLPPLAEQEKIVEIIEQMLPLCEKLGE